MPRSKRGLDRASLGGRLRTQGVGKPNRTGDQHVDELPGRIDADMCTYDDCAGRVGVEPGLVEKVGAGRHLVDGAAGGHRQRGARIAGFAHRTHDDGVHDMQFRRCPGRETKTAAAPEYAAGFGKCLHGIGEVVQSEADDHCVERFIFERQGCGVAFAKRQARVAPPCFRHHVAREVHAGHVRPACRRRVADQAGAAGDIEQPGADVNGDRIEQRRYERVADVTEGCGVSRRGALPARVFEFAEGLSGGAGRAFRLVLG